MNCLGDNEGSPSHIQMAKFTVHFMFSRYRMADFVSIQTIGKSKLSFKKESVPRIMLVTRRIEGPNFDFTIGNFHFSQVHVRKD